MRIACVLITHLRAKAELRRRPHLGDAPMVVVDRTSGTPLVIDRFPGASTVPVTLEEAVSGGAGVNVLEADEPFYRGVFRRVLDALQSISHSVEGAELGTAYVRVDGLEGLYGGEARLVSTLLNSIPAYLRARVGVGGAKFPAFAAAHSGRTPGAVMVPPDAASFLAPFSIDVLPVSRGVKAALRRFGMHTMGDAARMKKRLLSDRFGREGLRAWDLCNGIDESPLVPMEFDESVAEHTSLPFYSASIEILLAAVDTLLQRAYARPQARNRYAGRVTLECGVTGAPPWSMTVTLKGGASGWERAARAVRARLEADPPGAPVEDVTLTLSGFTGESGTQMALLKDVRDDGQRRIVEAARQLRPRMNGTHALHRIVDVAPWHPVPEMRAVQVPVDPSGRDAVKPLYLPAPVPVREDAGSGPASVLLGGRWRRVASIDDLWNLDLWWLPKPISRTYYRITGDDGRNLILFRDQKDGRWYRHGGKVPAAS